MSLEELIFRLVPSPDFDHDKDRRFLERELKKHFAGEFKVELRLVEDIPRAPSGKWKFVVSDLAMNYLKERFARSL